MALQKALHIKTEELFGHDVRSHVNIICNGDQPSDLNIQLLYLIADCERFVRKTVSLRRKGPSQKKVQNASGQRCGLGEK